MARQSREFPPPLISAAQAAPPVTPIDADRRRGRGALSNDSGRFERHSRSDCDDGWDIPEDRGQFRTEVTTESPRSVITRNRSPDISFDRSINPYRGCEHGCIYCFARPTHAYLGLSPGLDFETRLVARPGADRVLARELAAPSYRPATVMLGTATDAYQPVERKLGITRAIVRVLADHNHPLGIATKGTLVERDIDLLAPMAERGLVRVGVSVTTLDPDVSRRMEPRVPAPTRRLRMIERLAKAGIPVRVMVSPVVPGLTDPELEAILAAARDAGARFASWVMLRLPREVSPLVREWLADAHPNRQAKVMDRLRAMHGGRDYDARWGERMRGTGPFAQLIDHRFALATRRLGLEQNAPDLRTDLFAVPPKAGDQLKLF